MGACGLQATTTIRTRISTKSSTKIRTTIPTTIERPLASSFRTPQSAVRSWPPCSLLQLAGRRAAVSVSLSGSESLSAVGSYRCAPIPIAIAIATKSSTTIRTTIPTTIEMPLASSFRTPQSAVRSWPPCSLLQLASRRAAVSVSLSGSVSQSERSDKNQPG
jgi:hypothetical protein